MSAAPQLIRAASLAARPWKNGGGDTREIAAGPDGAGLNDFDWRLSLARVASDGPFSRFPGIDRTLTVLEGGDMHLAVQGRPKALLGPRTAPYVFPGDVAADAVLAGPPLLDCNVMTRRGVFAHRVRAVVLQGERRLTLAGAVLFVVARRGSLVHGGHALATGDTLWWPEGGCHEVVLTGTDAEVLAVELAKA